LERGIDQMHADVIFDHFAHQAVDRAPRGRDELQHVGTADFLLKRPLDGLDLSPNAPHAIQEFGFLSDGMGHGGNSSFECNVAEARVAPPQNSQRHCVLLGSSPAFAKAWAGARGCASNRYL
jgi:hypothetical protein